MELRLCLCPPDGEERHINETCPERKYVFIWRQNDYLKAAVDEIQWIEAAGSYSRIHLTGGRTLFERVIFLGVTGNSFPTRRVLYRLAVDYAG